MATKVCQVINQIREQVRWNPFAYIDPDDAGNLKGLLPEFIEIMQATCTNLDVSWTHTAWGMCFSEPEGGGSHVGDDIKVITSPVLDIEPFPLKFKSPHFL